MTIHKEGYPSLLLIFFVNIVVVGIVNYFFPQQTLWHYFTYALLLVLFFVVLQFFRSPARKTTLDSEKIICPADGKVVVIEQTEETECLKDKRIQVSIFMSPLNVHVNRYPVGGTVSYYKYHPGKYLVAWHPKSSTDNERTTIVVDTIKHGEILFRQIAGALARRIVCYSKEGQKVEQGSEMGFIKFGSRVDVFLPLTAKVKVALGEKVKGGETILAEF